jgi:hypothetical protein
MFAALLIAYALRSENPFHPDEHFQVVEFAAFKAGLTPSSLMPWEFHAAMRPWFMPAIAYAVWRALSWVGVSDPFVWTTLLRLGAGALGGAAAVSLVQHSRETIFSRPAETVGAHPLRAHAWFVYATGIVAYLAVRFSSESLSASFFILGFVLLERTRIAPALSRAWRDILGNGLLALAVHCRYQTGLMVACYWAYCLASLWRSPARRRIATLLPTWLLGFALGFGIGATCDVWGYGRVCFPAYTYVRLNVSEGIAAAISTEPWYAYLYLPCANVLALGAIATLLGALLFWLRFPAHPFTWIMAPSFVGFSLMGHKEERFLFPLVPFAACCVVPLLTARAHLQARAELASPAWLGRITGLLDALAERLRGRARWGRAWFLLQAPAVVLLAVYALHWREHIPVTRHLHRNTRASDTKVVWLYDADTTHLPVYRHAAIEYTYAETCRLRRGDLLVTSHVAPPKDVSAELRYDEWPLADAAGQAQIQAILRWARARVGAAILPVGWLRVYRISEDREGTVCSPKPYEPMATEPPVQRRR